MEEPEELVQTNFTMLPRHINILKTVNNNLSAANRKVIEEYDTIRKNKVLDKHLLFFAIGLMIIIFSTLMADLFVMALAAAIGIAYVCYSTVSIVIWRLRK